MRPHALFISFVMMAVAGCVPDRIEDPVIDRSIEYFPLEVGKYIDYQVDSIVFDDVPGGNIMDTVSFQIREEITGFEIFAGDTIFYIHRFRRNNGAAAWQLKDVWTAERDHTEASRTEENLKFRKLLFPLRKGKRWIGTSYIHPSTTVLIGTENVQAFQDWEAEVLEYNVSGHAGNFVFNPGDLMHVRQTDTDDGNTKRFVFEKYARGIGLVERTDTILDSRCIILGDFTPCLGKPWLEHASKGYILAQVMIDHN